MLKFFTFTNVKVFFIVLVYASNFDLFEFSAAILEKGLFGRCSANPHISESALQSGKIKPQRIR